MDNQKNYLSMQQLRMDCKYLSNDIQIESGNFWFEGKDIKEFENRILVSDAFKKAKSLQLQSVDFVLSEV